MGIHIMDTIVVVIGTVITTIIEDIVTVIDIPIDLEMVIMELSICTVLSIMVIMILVFKLLFVDYGTQRLVEFS
jgi:hypothetical protein